MHPLALQGIQLIHQFSKKPLHLQQSYIINLRLMNHKKNHIIFPHRHNKRQSTNIEITTEVIIILNGIKIKNADSVLSVKRKIKMLFKRLFLMRLELKRKKMEKLISSKIQMRKRCQMN